MPARVSFYRPTGQSRRQARHNNDHEASEGLPVRRWSHQWITVGKPPTVPSPPPELPLPKQTPLLSPMTQALLSAARSASQLKPAPKPKAIPGKKYFMTKRWMQVPRHLEGPEPVYLSKVPDVKKDKPSTSTNNTAVAGNAVTAPAAAAATTAAAPKRRAPPPRRRARRGRWRRPAPKKKIEKPAGTAAAAAQTQSQAGGGDIEMQDAVTDPGSAPTSEMQTPLAPLAAEVEKREASEEKIAMGQARPTPAMTGAEGGLKHALPARPVAVLPGTQVGGMGGKSGM